MKYKHTQSGFTLVEMMVALGVFGIVVLIATGILISLSNTNYSSQVSRKTIDNVDFIMDDIIRELRLGKNYHCINPGAGIAANIVTDRDPSDCNLGSNKISFTQISTDKVVRYYTEVIAGKTVLKKQVINTDGSDDLPPTQISAQDIDIKDIKFRVNGALASDSIPAQVLVTLQAELKKGSRYRTLVNLQTTVVQRATDN
jgi:prepilin-type N-terminal cleavage/methylation domain-containing protein